MYSLILRRGIRAPRLPDILVHLLIPTAGAIAQEERALLGTTRKGIFDALLHAGAQAGEHVFAARPFALRALAQTLTFLRELLLDRPRILLAVDALAKPEEQRGFQIALAVREGGTTLGIPLLFLHLLGCELLLYVRSEGAERECELKEREAEGGEVFHMKGRIPRCCTDQK